MEQQQTKRRSRALPSDIKAMKAMKRIVDGLEPHEKQRVMEWANAYVEGVGQSATARYGMALEAILLVSGLDAHAIAAKALKS